MFGFFVYLIWLIQLQMPEQPKILKLEKYSIKYSWHAKYWNKRYFVFLHPLGSPHDINQVSAVMSIVLLQ